VGAAPAGECTPKPSGPAPQGQHWYYVLDRAAKRQCWHLGPLGMAVQRSALLRSRHHAAASAETAAAGEAEPHAAMTGAAPATTVANVPAAPPEPAARVAQIMDRAPPSEPAPPAPAAGETRSAEAAVTAPPSTPIEAPRSPAITRSAAAPGEADHTYALTILAAALLMIVGPVLALMRWWSRRRAGAEQPLGHAVRRAPAVPVVAKRRPAGYCPPIAADQPPEDIGVSLRRLLDEALPKEYPRASTPAST